MYRAWRNELCAGNEVFRKGSAWVEQRSANDIADGSYAGNFPAACCCLRPVIRARFSGFTHAHPDRSVSMVAGSGIRREILDIQPNLSASGWGNGGVS